MSTKILKLTIGFLIYVSFAISKSVSCQNEFSSIEMPDLTAHFNWNLLDHENCGPSSMDRIIGGKNASLGQFPWLARIGYSTKHDLLRAPAYKCGGSLINKMYVLTAAHCVAAIPKQYIVTSVRLGENSVQTNIDCENNVCAAPAQDFAISTIVVHKKYGKPPYRHDVALIRLNSPAIYNRWVQPICLPYGLQLVETYEGSTAEVAGWGVYDLNQLKGSDYLLYVSLPVVTLNRCISAFRRYASITTTQLCVGGVAGQDSCSGDSGGPLVKAEAVHGSPRYYIIGVVSFGAKSCGSSTMPAIYTKMSAYVLWVLDNMFP